MGEYMPVPDLALGVYEVDDRNFRRAIHLGHGVFLGARYKFGHWMLDKAVHWDDGGTLKPLRLLGGATDFLTEFLANEAP